MIKINKFKKQTDRLLVVSEKKLYKVDAAKIKVIQEDDLTMFMMILVVFMMIVVMFMMIVTMFMMILVTQVMREEGLEQVTGLSCGTGDNQMVKRIIVVY